MKNQYFILLLTFFVSTYSLSTDRYWVASGPGDWNDANNWTDSPGGTPPALPPVVGDNVFFTNNGQGDCNLDVDVSIEGFNVASTYDGTINLNGRSFNPASGGTGHVIIEGTGSITNTGPTTISFTTSGNVLFQNITIGTATANINLDFTSPYIRFNGGVFNGTVTAVQYGAGPANGAGGCEFNGLVTLTNLGAGQLSLGQSNPDIFNGELRLFNSGSSFIRIATTGFGHQFNENIEVNSTGGLGVYIGGFTGGGSTGGGALASSKTISVGSGGFSVGTLRLGSFIQAGGAAQNITLTGTAKLLVTNSSNFSGDVTVVAPRISTLFSTYQGVVTFLKNGAGTDDSGGNVFEQNTTITHTGSELLRFGEVSADQFLADVTLNNIGSGTIEIAQGSPGNVISGNLDIITGGASKDVRVSSEAAASINIGGNVNITSGSSSIVSNIYIGNEGDVVINGTLDFVQNATGDSSSLRIAETTPSSVYIGGVATLFNSGAGVVRRLFIGYSGDIVFNDDLIINNSATSSYNNGVYLNHFPGSTNNYNGNIILSNTASDGISFGRGTGSPPGGFGELANGKTIIIGPSGFSNGELYFRNFTQFGATTPQSIQPTGTTKLTILYCEWQGGGDFISPRITTRNTIYGGLTHLEKTGAFDDLSYGANQFLLNTTIRNTGSGAFSMGVLDAAPINYDLWNSDLTVISEGSGDISIAYNSGGNEIAGDLNVIANSLGTQNSYFSRYGFATLLVGGNTNVLNAGVAGNVGIILGLDGDVNFVGNLTVTSTASSPIAEVIIASGINSQVVVGGVSNISNLGVGGTIKRVVLGLKGDVTFNGTLILDNSATSSSDSYILLNSDIESINMYKGDILLNSTTNGASGDDGIFFGRRTSTTAGQGTLDVGYALSVGASDFIGQELLFRNFTQLGTTPQNFVPPTGATRFESRESIWYGPVTFISARVFSNGSTYDLSAHYEKTGAMDDASRGGNTFNGPTIIENSGTGNLIFANQSGDDFNDDVTHIKTGSGLMLPTYNATSTYAGSITVDANTVVEFGANPSGRVVMDGTIPQFISAVGSTPRPEFRALETQNSINEITLGTPILIRNELKLFQGNIVSSAVNLVTMIHNSNVTAVSDNAFVDGPISKIGKDPFVFPVGKQGYYRPISISGPNVIDAQFNAEYFPQDIITSGTPDNPVAATIDHVSNCEYWILDKEAGISTIAVQVTLSYRDVPAFNCSGVVNPAELIVSRWDGSIWIDHGNDIASLTGNATNGTVTSFGPISNFSPFTIATTTANNPLPIELTLFEVEKQGTAAMVNWTTASELNNDYFNLERSSDGYNFESIAIVDGAGNSSTVIDYEYLDRDPKTGINYYRLKQTDFDGEFSYSDIKSVEFDAWDYLNIYPNPLISGKDLKISSTQIITQIDILNDLGQLVYTHTLSGKDMEFKIANLTLSPSVYFVKIHSNDYVEVKKLIVR